MSSPSSAPDRAVTRVSTVRARSEHRWVQSLYERWGMGAMESTQCSMLRQTDRRTPSGWTTGCDGTDSVGGSVEDSFFLSIHATLHCTTLLLNS